MTSELESAFDWFKWTHEFGENGWTRRELPRADRGLARQDARLMLLLDVIRTAANDVERERQKVQKERGDVKSWRANREKALRKA